MKRELKQIVIEEVLSSIVRDVQNGDLTVLEELLKQVPNKVLVASLSEEKQEELGV